MSTKNNIFFNAYIDAKVLLEAVVYSEIERVENDKMAIEIFNLREAIRLQLEAEEALKAELAAAANSQNVESSPEVVVESTITTEVVSAKVEPETSVRQTPSEGAASPESETPSEGAASPESETPSEGAASPESEGAAEENTAEAEAVKEVITEESIQAAYAEKLKLLRSLSAKELYLKYISIFSDFNFEEGMEGALTSRLWPDSVIAGKQSLIHELINNYNILYNFAASGNSNHSPLIFLFISRLRSSSFHLFEKFYKVKFNKLRFKKKRKLKKIRTLRKIKKILLFKKSKKKFIMSYHQTSKFIVNTMKPECNILVRRIPISQRVIETTNVEFFYKHNKDTKAQLLHWTVMTKEELFDSDEDLLIYLRNYHQKPYLKLRKARVAHWNLFFNKTIRKQRYKGFINKYIRDYKRMSYAYAFFVNYFTSFQLSWSRTSKLESFLKNSLTENLSDSVLKIPLFFANVFKWRFLKKKNYYARKKVGRWSYLNFKRATCPWLQRKKGSPKIANHLQPNFFYLSYISWWDSMTGYVLLDESLITNSLPACNQFKANFLLRLHMYRYKANIKCMWLQIIIFFCVKELSLLT